MSETIAIYGAHWCPDCRRAKKFLADQRVAFEWHDMESEPDAGRIVQERNDGDNTIPTIVFPDGSHLSEPTNEELADKLGLQRSAMQHVYDLIIVGGGPTGLTTGIYAARENLETLIVDSKGLGGQAGITERLDNYPGFPDGIGGAELADRIVRQAERYGVETLQAMSVTSITDEGHHELDVETATGEHYHARAVLIATRLVVPAHRGARRGGPDRGRHPLLRDLRRSVLQGSRRADGDRRRQLRSRGGAVPHPVRRARVRGRVPRGAARLEVPAGQGAAPPEDGGAREPRGAGVPAQGRRQRQARHRGRAGSRDRRVDGAPSGRACSCSSASTRTPGSCADRSTSTRRGSCAQTTRR